MAARDSQTSRSPTDTVERAGPPPREPAAERGSHTGVRPRQGGLTARAPASRTRLEPRARSAGRPWLSTGGVRPCNGGRGGSARSRHTSRDGPSREGRGIGFGHAARGVAGGPRRDLRRRERPRRDRRPAPHLRVGRARSTCARSPALVCLPGHGGRGAGEVVRACHEAERSLGRARRRDGALGRRARRSRTASSSGSRACAGSSRSTCRTARVVVEPGVDQSRRLARRRADALLPARPVQPGRLHRRRERRRELGRRALLQVRVHDELRDRARGRPPGRRRRHARRQGARPARARPRRRVRRLRGNARHRDADHAARRPRAREHDARSSRTSTRWRRPGQTVSDIVAAGHRPGRDRDHGPPLAPRRRGRRPAPGTRSTWRPR